MQNTRVNALRVYATTVVTLFAMLHLSIEYFNGGVISHNLLNRADMPAISNWWGLLLLPLLAWFLIPQMQSPNTGVSRNSCVRAEILGFAGALFYGVVLAASFEYGHEEISSAMFLGMFVLAAALPIYRAKFVLGFVIGMTFTFGAVLPTLVTGIMALISFMLRTLGRYAYKAVR